jgi:hypothetical protein
MNMQWRWHSQRSWSQLALGVWLIATGLLPLLNISIPYGGQLLSLLAVVAGVLIIMRR